MWLRNFLRLLIAMAVSFPPARAEDAVVETAPFVNESREEALPGRELRSFVAARRALELGFPSVAAELFTRLINNPGVTGGERDLLALELATARLDEGRIDEAERALQLHTGVPGPAYQLRAGLIAARRKRPDLVRAALGAAKVDELPVSERGWWHFLQGQAADLAGDFGRARDAYQSASDAAVSEIQRAHFVLARERARVALGEAGEAQLNTLRQNAERYQGKTVGYAYARQYAAALALRGRAGEAIDYLSGQLRELPAGERATRDDFRLVMGLIAGAQRAEGRNALEGLLASAGDPTLQRVALRLLARDAADAALYSRLNTLINAPTPHPIQADLLLVRAQLALDEKRVPMVERAGVADTPVQANLALAEQDAKTILARFPGSDLKPAALGVLADLAWQLKRFRSAADYAAQARAELPPGQVRGSLGVMVAEAYFRAGDFESASQAYALALNEVPVGVSPGALIGQRVLSKVKANRLNDAAALLDQHANDPRLELVQRWKAEWALARAFQATGRDAEAYARVNALMARGEGEGGLPSSLRARMGWLQARLALEADEATKAIELASALPATLDGLEASLGAEVEASARLLKAKAQFRLGDADAALKTLKDLREQFPKSDAAVYSYIDEADHYAEQDRFADSQRLLTTLADDFKEHAYAPYALYRAALNAEQRGEDRFYEEAYLILGKLVEAYPNSPLVFHARLKQGDLARRMNDFPRARLTYEFLINNHSQHPGVLSAELALAACHRAQITAGDVSHYESALTILERLQDLPAASVDLRVEAGFQLGDLLATSGKAAEIARAESVWWTLATTYLLDDAQAAKLGAKGRYWIARALLRVGDQRRERGDLESARNAYELVLVKKLPFAKLAGELFVRAGGKLSGATASER